MKRRHELGLNNAPSGAIFSITLALMLAGCGGGGGASAAPVAVVTPTPASTPAPTPTPTPTTMTANSLQVAAQMSPGWNLGNALESANLDPTPATTSRETAYGNPAVTQAVLDGVAAAGFKSVRIPVSWLQYADSNDNISQAWLTRVAEVVGYARNAGLNVIINIHYDGGWLLPTYAAQPIANARLTKFWTQIATKFKDFDSHVMFAGTNEVKVTDTYSAPTVENCAVQNGFNQKFIDAVRATGGSNASRYLVVQGYNTNIDYTVSCNTTLPIDTTPDHLMFEVHFYDPYDFADNPSSKVWQWGATATDPTVTANYGNEAYIDAQFAKMKATFVDKGVPVIIGEYAAISKTEYDPTGKYRTLWDAYVTQSARNHQLVPFYWDNGETDNHTDGLFNRANGAQVYPTTIQAIVNAAR